jgi:hypothetical protein
VTQFLRRQVALSMAKFGSVVETRLSYVDPDLIAALLAAPAGLKLGDQIQAHLLRRHAPALLRVPNANTGARLEAGPARTALARSALRLLSKLRVSGYEPYERLGLWLRCELRPVVERVLLAEQCLDRGVFDPDAVRAVIDEHADRRRNHTYLILTMMAFELGQRELADGESPAGARPS